MFGSKGSDSGSMKGPNDVKCDKDGRYVVADTFNHRISWYDNVSLRFHLSLSLELLPFTECSIDDDSRKWSSFIY